MDIRPMADLQTAIARQEDVKRQEQREEKLRELAKKRAEDRRRLADQMHNEAISATNEIQEIDHLGQEVPVGAIDAESQKGKPHSDKNDSLSYFKDPDLGGQIDISS